MSEGKRHFGFAEAFAAMSSSSWGKTAGDLDSAIKNMDAKDGFALYIAGMIKEMISAAKQYDVSMLRCAHARPEPRRRPDTALMMDCELGDIVYGANMDDMAVIKQVVCGFDEDGYPLVVTCQDGRREASVDYLYEGLDFSDPRDAIKAATGESKHAVKIASRYMKWLSPDLMSDKEVEEAVEYRWEEDFED